MSNVCPMGFFCFDKDTILLLIVAMILFTSYFMYNTRTKMDKVENDLKSEIRKVQEEYGNENVPLDTVLSPNMYLVNKDYERIVNPLLPPERSSPFPLGRVGLPINIPTRGYSSGYQQMGFLEQENPDDQNNKKIIALYGQETYPGSNYYNYYTNTDGFQSVKLGVRRGNRDCMDDTGCKELYNGDSVEVQGYNGSYKANIYKYDTPRYIPNVL